MARAVGTTGAEVPAHSITWETFEPDIASVSPNGLVSTGGAPGTTKIRARAGKATDSNRITVEAPTHPVADSLNFLAHCGGGETALSTSGLLVAPSRFAAPCWHRRGSAPARPR
jgi:Bacterial Ig-like domain (group 2)